MQVIVFAKTLIIDLLHSRKLAAEKIQGMLFKDFFIWNSISFTWYKLYWKKGIRKISSLM